MSTDPEPTAPETHRKPPFLRRVRIRNFKSIKFCDVTLEPLTVLVGRNGSGKSNFVEALAFLRDVVDEDASKAVRQHRGRQRILSRDARSDSVSFEVSAFFTEPNGKAWNADYQFELVVEKGRSPEIVVERLSMAPLGVGTPLGFTRRRNGLLQDQLGDNSATNFVLTADRPFLRHYAAPPATFLLSRFRGVRTHNFLPDRIRELQLPEPEEYLKSDGANLASVYNEINLTDPDLAERVARYFSTIVGSVQVMGIVFRGEYVTMQFRVPRDGSTKSMKFDAVSMSDGTLRTLAALVAAYQSGWPDVSPTLVAIEEPETALHPAAMHALVDALDEATGRTQILLTTHSTELLDNPTIRPENVRVVEMVDGETVITPVDEGSVEIVKRQLDTLGGLERQNQLSLNDADRERQQQLAAGAEPK